MSEKKLNTRKCKQGLDGINAEFVMELEGLNGFTAPPDFCKNKKDNTIIKIECINGKLKSFINLVNCIRTDNTVPFGIADAIKIELVRGQVVEFMKAYLRKNMGNRHTDEIIRSMRVTSLECNITQPVAEGATPSDVIALFDLALDKTMVFRRRRSEFDYRKKNTGCMYIKPKEYKLKIYDKTEEQRQKGNLSVEKNLLRIEVVFIDRLLSRMYGKDRLLIDMLSVQSIEIACHEYKRVLEDDLIKHSIKPCLDSCVEHLLESLTNAEKGYEISEAVINNRDMIPDIEVLRKALKKWYRRSGKRNYSKQAIPIENMENSMARMMLETINNMMIELYASMAQAEMEKKEKRQREGIEAKKARGEWSDYGRPRVMTTEEFAKRYKAVEHGEKKPFELMKEMGMTKATFYRYKGMIKKEG